MDERALVEQVKDMQTSNNNSRWNSIGIFDMFDDGKYLWFTSIEYNALFKMNKHTFQVDYIGSFPDEETYGYRLYTSINECSGKLFFTPCTAHEIGVYDTKKKSFDKISIGISREENDLSKIKYAKKFVSGFVYNNALILIPCCYDSIVTCDIITGKVSFQNSMFEHFYAKYNDCTRSLDAEFYLCWFAKRVNESEIVFNLHCNRNILVFYNLETGEFREQSIGSENGTFSLIECDGSQVYLYEASTDTLVKWEMKSGKYSECHIVDKLSEFQPCGLEHSFLNMAVSGKNLYLIPLNANIAVKVNIITLDAGTVDVLSDECSNLCGRTAYLNLCKFFDNKLYLFGNRRKELIIYGKDGECQYIKIKVPDNIENIIAEKHLADFMYNNYCWFSDEQIPLTRFINAIACLETEKYNRSACNGNEMVENCGSRIYHLMKQYLLN